jgi:serine/threonine protein phosphatase 1
MPPGEIVYAIGDIHGRYDLLQELLGMITVDYFNTRKGKSLFLIFLGDYIDRGPDSARVISQVHQLVQQAEGRVRALKGNHEQVLLDFLVDPEAARDWLGFGGVETLQSYGVQVPMPPLTTQQLHALSRDLLVQMPPEHLEFLESLRPIFIMGDYVFVHAGLRPGVALADQSEHDLLWLREDASPKRWTFDKVAVHGHTPVEHVRLDTDCVGIDTGAYETDVLTALRMEDRSRQLIQT